METISNFRKNGFVVLENFLSSKEVESLKTECDNIVENRNVADHLSIFETGKNQVGDKYFLNSGDKISFFFEKDAVSHDGAVLMDKTKCLNKIGHALHWHNAIFKKITFSQKIKDVVKDLGYIDPVVVQSMYIFKHPKIGGEVVPHQDSTFLHTTPLSAVGLWFPLVDVSEENGCLWFYPGSHKKSIYQRFIRNSNNKPLLKLEGEMVKHDDSVYVPVRAKKGDCVVIHGSVIHKSELNQSKDSRPVYTFHVVENHNTAYSDQNWLQPTAELPFPSLFQTLVE